jgi:hypothetical protein
MDHARMLLAERYGPFVAAWLALRWCRVLALLGDGDSAEALAALRRKVAAAGDAEDVRAFAQIERAVCGAASVETPAGPELPLYEHDCDRCEFLGRHVGDGVFRLGVFAPPIVDLYVCERRDHVERFVDTTLIVRYGDEPQAYSGRTVQTARVYAAQSTRPYIDGMAEALRRYDAAKEARGG